MRYEELLKTIRKLPVGSKETIYKIGTSELSIERPEKLGSSLKRKDYNVNKNFKIVLSKTSEKPFLPTT